MANFDVTIGHQAIRAGWDEKLCPFFTVDILAYDGDETIDDSSRKRKELRRWLEQPNLPGGYFMVQWYAHASRGQGHFYRYYFTHQETAALFKLFHAPI